ncbi:MAG: chromosomal replication initiator protein DnaA [Verrucomicrobiae bacterium]|nr:chromosomal replication initiator protein DnaA [Verrucomicrobiae bacterium]
MNASMQHLWDDACAKLRGMLNEDTYNLWFAALKPASHANHVFSIGVPNEFIQIWLQENYRDLIRDILAQVSGDALSVKFVVQPDLKVPTPPPAPKQIEVAEPKESRDGESKMNPRNTFDSFVVGPSNHFAHAASMAVAQSPAKAYNPLFIYGGVGLGKTHLMQAIGQFANSKKKTSKVVYISSERFINEFIAAIQNSSLVKFRKKYRQADILLIDDIHFLGGKERLQEEFFHTFNSLFDSHRQIVMSSDRPANEIPGLEQRLVSRFEWGLVTEMQPPDMETRVAILRKKEEQMQIKLPDEIIFFLAEKIRSNIRRLEGALIRVASYASLTGAELTPQAIEHLLRDALHEESRRSITVETIQKRVAEHFDIRMADMTSKRRPQNIAFPRQVAMYLTRKLTSGSLSDIGESFGGRDHGTVLHACRLVESLMEQDPSLRQTVSYLNQQLQR